MKFALDRVLLGFFLMAFGDAVDYEIEEAFITTDCRSSILIGMASIKS